MDNSAEPFENWFQTRYETKAKREGRETRYLTFRKA
jgi:heme-degrading monooxygenase HmoA